MPSNVPTMDEFNALAQRVTTLEQGKPNPSQPSPDGTTVTTIGPAIIDSKGRSFTLTNTVSAGLTPPGVAINGSYSANSQRVKQLYAKGGICHQQNLDLNWWNMPNGTWVACPDPTGTTPPNPSSGAMTIANGQLLRGGSPFIIKGVSIIDSMIPDFPASWLMQAFPHLNAVNLSIGADGRGYETRQPDSVLYKWIDDATNRGLVVTLSDYMPGQPLVRTGQDLTNSCNWYATIGGRYKSNNNIIWLTENEVKGNPDLTTSHLAIYNALRGAGAMQPLFMETWCGNPQLDGLNTASYANLHNVGWCNHLYPWMMPTTQNQADYDNKARSIVSMMQGFARSADGVMPVLFGEAGNSTNGNGGPADDRIINGKYATTQAHINTTSGSNASCGWLAWVCSWHWYQSPPPPAPEESDTLVRHDWSLSNYGNQVAGAL